MKHAIKDFIYISAVLITLLVAVTILDTFTGAIVFDPNFTESNISEELTLTINESALTTLDINVTTIENESNIVQEQNVSNEITTDLIVNITGNISNESQENITQERNISIENVSVENVTNWSISEVSPQNETVEINVSTQNLTSETNITISKNETQQNVTVNETAIATINVTLPEPNITVENATVIEEKVIQYPAVIGQPVKWKKTVKLDKEITNLEINLPKDIEIISIKEIENNQKIDITSDVINSPTPLTGFFLIVSGFAVVEEPTATSLIIDQPVEEIEIEYETEAPRVSEQEISAISKIITISSEVSYENVLTYTSMPDANIASIKLYWLVNETRVPHEITDYVDTDNSGKIDQIYWITPHLSNQSFQVDITILNIQSFPKVGKNWTVNFTTNGTANLTITPINGTTYGTAEPDDLQFLELKCDTSILSPIFNGSSVFMQDYNCNNMSQNIVKVLSIGKHILKFEFGGDTDYAFNLAGLCGNTTGCECNDTIVSNRTMTVGPDPIFNAPCAADGLMINTSGIEVSCSGNAINGSGIGVGINFSRDTNRSTITNCQISDFDAGIDVGYNATMHYIFNNNISYNDQVGINISHEANHTNSTRNRVFRNGLATDGVGIYSSGYNTTSDEDTVYNNTLHAVYFYNMSASRIESIFANDSSIGYGILFEFVNSTNLTDVAARGNNRSGIRLANSSRGNRIELGSYEYNALVGGLRNDFGSVDIDDNSTNNLIHNNTIQHNVRGLFIGRVQTSENNSILGNTFSNNSYANAIINNSLNNTIMQQTFPNITIFSNSTAGDINFTNDTIYTFSVRFIEVINITENRIYVNSTNVTGLNVTADILLRNLSFNNPQPEIEDNGAASFRACNAPECNELSYTGNRFIFNVTHFTQYRAGETPTTPPPTGGGNPSRPWQPTRPRPPTQPPTPAPPAPAPPGPTVTPAAPPTAPPTPLNRRDRNRQCWNNSGVTYSDFRVLDPILSTYNCTAPLSVPIIAQIKDKILGINLGDKANIDVDFSERLPIFSLFFGEEGHLEAPFKVRIINWLWLILLIIAILATLYLIRKEIRYLKGKESPKVQLPLIRKLPEQIIRAPEKIEVPQTFEEPPEFLIPEKVKSTKLNRLLTKATRFAVVIIRSIKLPKFKLPRINIPITVQIPKRILRKLEEKVTKEIKLISLEKEKKLAAIKIQEFKKQHLEVSRTLEEARHAILTKLKLNEKEIAELESKFRSQLPSAPELMPHPEVKEIPRHLNDSAQFNYLYSQINKRIQLGDLITAHHDYKALLLIYNRLINEISNKEDLYNLTKSLHARLSSAILVKRYGKLEDLENA